MINNTFFKMYWCLKNFFYTHINSFRHLLHNELPSNDLALINFENFFSNLFYKEINEPLLFSDTNKKIKSYNDFWTSSKQVMSESRSSGLGLTSNFSCPDLSNGRSSLLFIELETSTKSTKLIQEFHWVATYLVGFFDICRFYHLFGNGLFSPSFYMFGGIYSLSSLSIFVRQE